MTQCINPSCDKECMNNKKKRCSHCRRYGIYECVDCKSECSIHALRCKPCRKKRIAFQTRVYYRVGNSRSGRCLMCFKSLHNTGKYKTCDVECHKYYRKLTNCHRRYPNVELYLE